MDQKPIGGQFAPSEQMVIADLTEAERRAAMLTVCANATDAGDARLILESLGLLADT